MIISLSDFKANAARILEHLRSTDETVVLTQNGSASAVVQDYESFQRTKDALLMLKLLVQGESDIRTGRTTPQDRVFVELRGRLRESDG